MLYRPCVAIFALLLPLAAGRAALAQPATGSAQEVLPSGLEPAIGRGLFFIQKQQKPNGSFDATGPANAMTGLALLAFLSAGHTPDTGKYGLTVRGALDHLAKLNPPDGYYGNDGGRMYSHCIVTIALAEASGTENDEKQRKTVRQSLEKALAVICAAQDVPKGKDHEGGRRYETTSADSDLSVSTWCILALRACQNAGLVVPKARADRALAYVLRCYRADQKAFGYTPSEAPTASLAGAAVLDLHLLDASDRPEIPLVLAGLTDNSIRQSRYYYYCLYFTTVGAFQAGGNVWPTLWKGNSEQLLASQRREDGSWPFRNPEPGGDNKPGRFYATTMACMTLSVPLRLLPIYQR